jgi:peptide/nickel transport system substrate-binding protein
MVVACAVPFQQSKAEGGGVFVVALDSPALTLDPANATELSSARVISQVYETLVTLNGTTGGFDPWLAQSWVVSSDGKVWTFTLRSGVTFHDGTPLNSEAVVDNFNRWFDTSDPLHQGDFDYWQIFFNGFKGGSSVVRSVDRVDDLRLRITLEQAYSPLLSALAMYPLAIVSPTAMRANIDDLPRHPAGTGPFRVAEWQANDTIALTANPQYWGVRPKLDGVRFVVMPNSDDRAKALKSGKVHLAEGSNANDAAAAKQAGLKVVLRPANSVVSLSINQKADPFSDQVVRQAVAQAINRQALVDKAYGGLALVADQFVPPGIAGNDRSLGGIAHSPQAARQLLSAAGYGGGIITQIWYPSLPRLLIPNPRTMAEAIADDLRAVGILASTNAADWTVYQQRSLEGGYPLYLQGWTQDIPDADSYLTGLFASNSTATTIGYNNPELKTTLADARAQPDAAGRSSLYKQAAATVRQDMPRAPLVYPQRAVLLAPGVSGYAPSALGMESYAGITLAP